MSGQIWDSFQDHVLKASWEARESTSWFVDPCQTYPTDAGWWYTYPSKKYESVWMMTFPIYGKHKFHVPNHQPVTIFHEPILNKLDGFSQ